LLPRAEALAGQLQPSLPQPQGFVNAAGHELEARLKPRVDAMVRRQMNGFNPVTGRSHEPDERDGV
jgi:hypothetical protein